MKQETPNDNLFYLSTKTKLVNALLFSAAVLIFTYTLVRAMVLSITWDEAFSYLQFVRHSIILPEKFESMDANNHLLNTWLNIGLTKVFGVSEFVLRIPSLVAHFLFLIYTYKYVKTFVHQWFGFAAFLLLNTNPYLLDFFSLSRGYGLSVGLMMASVYYLYVFVVDEKSKSSAVVSIIIAVLAVLANFVLLNYLFALTLILLVVCARDVVLMNVSVKEGMLLFFRKSWIVILLFVVAMLFVLPIVFKLKEAQALYFGGVNGIWKDTIATLVDRSLYELGYGYWLQRCIKSIVILTIIGVFVFVAIKEFRQKFSKQIQFVLIIAIIVLLCGFMNMAQHQLFGTPYLMERTALFFIPLFSVLVVSFFHELFKTNKRFAFFLYAFSTLMLFHAVRAINVNYVLEWKSNWCAKQMIKDIERVIQIPKEKNSVSVYTPLAFMQSINFYRAVDNLTWLNTATALPSADLMCDYLCMESTQANNLVPGSVDVINNYSFTNAVLAKSKLKTKNCLVKKVERVGFETQAGGSFALKPEIEFGPGFTYVIEDSLLKLPSEVVFKANVLAPNTDLLHTSVVCTFENKAGAYSWKRAFVKDYIRNVNEWTDVYFTCTVPQETKSGDIQKFYFWNSNQRELQIKSMELKWIGYP